MTSIKRHLNDLASPMPRCIYRHQKHISVYIDMVIWSSMYTEQRIKEKKTHFWRIFKRKWFFPLSFYAQLLQRADVLSTEPGWMAGWTYAQCIHRRHVVTTVHKSSVQGSCFEFLIYWALLRSAQICKHFNSPSSGSSPPVHHLWPPLWTAEHHIVALYPTQLGGLHTLILSCCYTLKISHLLLCPQDSVFNHCTESWGWPPA